MGVSKLEGKKLEGKKWLVSLTMQGREEGSTREKPAWAFVDKVGRRGSEGYVSVVLEENDGEICKG